MQEAMLQHYVRPKASGKELLIFSRGCVLFYTAVMGGYSSGAPANIDATTLYLSEAAIHIPNVLSKDLLKKSHLVHNIGCPV